MRLIQRFSSDLALKTPQEMLMLWMRVPSLDPRDALSALFRHIDPKLCDCGTQQKFRFISRMFSQSVALCNTLALFHAEHSEGEALLTFLAAGRAFDTEYTLRACHAYGRHAACVFLTGRLGRLDEAVRLALLHGEFRLAQENATLCLDDDQLRRYLWLKIIQHGTWRQAGGLNVIFSSVGANEPCVGCPVLLPRDIMSFITTHEANFVLEHRGSLLAELSKQAQQAALRRTQLGVYVQVCPQLYWFHTF